MKITHRISLILGVILALFIFSFFYVNYYLSAIEKNIALFTIADRMVEDILQARRHEKNFILRGDERYKDNTRYVDLVSNYLVQLEENIYSYRQLTHRKQDAPRIEELIKQLGIFKNEFKSYIGLYVKSNSPPESAVLISSGRIILDISSAFRDELSGSISSYLRNILVGKIIILFLFVIIGLIAYWFMLRTVVRPIKILQRLCQGVVQHAQLDDFQMKEIDKAIRELHAQGEIGELANVYREMLIAQKNANLSLREKIKEIEKLYAMKSEFTSTVSHEMRTPLSPIKQGTI